METNSCRTMEELSNKLNQPWPEDKSENICSRSFPFFPLKGFFHKKTELTDITYVNRRVVWSLRQHSHTVIILFPTTWLLQLGLLLTSGGSIRCAWLCCRSGGPVSLNPDADATPDVRDVDLSNSKYPPSLVILSLPCDC